MRGGEGRRRDERRAPWLAWPQSHSIYLLYTTTTVQITASLYTRSNYLCAAGDGCRLSLS